MDGNETPSERGEGGREWWLGVCLFFGVVVVVGEYACPMRRQAIMNTLAVS